MAIIPFFLRRPEAILRIPQAIARGLTQASFLRELDVLGLTYRKILMQRDYNSWKGIVEKAGWLKYERRNVLPPPHAMADVNYPKMDREYMYQVKITFREKPKGRLKTGFRNVMSDVPLTPEEIEQTYYKRYYKAHTIPPVELVKAEAWTALHKVIEEGEGE